MVDVFSLKIKPNIIHSIMNNCTISFMARAEEEVEIEKEVNFVLSIRGENKVFFSKDDKTVSTISFPKKITNDFETYEEKVVINVPNNPSTGFRIRLMIKEQNAPLLENSLCEMRFIHKPA